MPILEQLIQSEKPDVILLQETKCQDEHFPRMELESYGYNIAIHGQKTFNGVAILSKGPIEDVTKGLPNFQDEQARYIECITTINGQVVRVASVYVPNGQEVGSEKFAYKLGFMKALNDHFATLLSYEELLAVGGDYNIAPEEIDVYDPKTLAKYVGFHIEERKLLRESHNLGMYDSFRAKHPGKQEYSWWDYRTKSFEQDNGMRIDHILVSPLGADKLFEANILRSYRGLEKTSDHAPISVIFR